MATPDEDPRVALTIDLAALRRRGEDRHRVQLELPAGWLAEALAQTDAMASAPGKLALDVLLQPRSVVYVHGKLHVAYSVPCGRCLDPAAVSESTSITATFLLGGPEPGGPDDDGDEDGLGLSDGDLDSFHYQGTRLELADFVAEQVKLTYPMRALCERGEGCRGLCSNCGAALNGHEGTTCPACGRVVPQTPVADLPDAPEDGGATDAEDAGEGPLAAALRKLMS